MDILLNWLDLLWIPAAFMLLPLRQALKMTLLILSCVFTLRLQIELMEQIGYPYGILSLLDFPQLWRGYVVYGGFITLFFVLSKFSKNVSAYVFIAASLTFYFAAFFTSSVVMML
jgi:hypothetical protein